MREITPKAVQAMKILVRNLDKNSIKAKISMVYVCTDIQIQALMDINGVNMDKRLQETTFLLERISNALMLQPPSQKKFFGRSNGIFIDKRSELQSSISSRNFRKNGSIKLVTKVVEMVVSHW